MSCKCFGDQEALFEDYLAGAADPRRAQELENHLGECETCRRLIEEARFTSRMLRESLEPTAPPSETFWTRLRARLDAEDERRQATEFLPSLEWLASRLALGSAVALLILGAFILGSETRWMWNASQQAEVREMVPRPVQPLENDEDVLVLLATNGNGR